MSSRLRLARDADPSWPRLTEDQRRLVASVLDLVVTLARRHAPGLRGEAFDDLVAQGRLGACLAATRYVPEGLARYSSFATPFIVGRMVDWLRKEGRYSKLLRKASEAARAFVAETPDTFCLSWDDEATLGCKARSFVEQLLASMAAAVAAAAPEPDELVIQAEMIAVVREALDEVEESERKIYRLRYVEALTLEEAAARLGVSVSTVRRGQEALLDKIAARLHAAGFTEMPERWGALPMMDEGDALPKKDEEDDEHGG